MVSILKKKHKTAAENFQKRATKLVPNFRNSTYTERLKYLGIPSLEYRRERADMIQVFKILHKYKKSNSTMFKLTDNNRTRGNNFKLFKQRSRTELRRNSFSNRFVNKWNALDKEMVLAPSVNSFKGGYLDFSHLTEPKDIIITEIYMKKQY